MRKWIIAVAGVSVLSGCLFGGKPKPPPPVETVETTRIRADSLYRAARVHLRNGKWSKASQALDRALLIMQYDDPRRQVGHFMMGEALMAQGNQLQAVREFRRAADEGGSDSLAADALLRAGDAYAELWRRPELDPTYGETALQTYREVQQRYDGALAAQRAAVRVGQLEEMFAAKEYRTALFYFRIKAYDSAILSLRHVVATYPRTQIVPDALVKLVEAYRKNQYVEDLREACQYIARFFPGTAPRVAETCPETTTGAP